MAEYYQWCGLNLVPTKAPVLAFDKINHNDVEPEIGRYDFLPLDLKILKAASQGMTYGFLPRPMREVNDWVTPLPVEARNWNNEIFLSNYCRFIAELGTHLRTTGLLRHIEFVIMGYGAFGEGSDLDGMQVKTDSVLRIIDAFFEAFPTTRLITPSKTRAHLVRYALLRGDNTGWYVANLGGGSDYFDDINPELRSRYCVGEFRSANKSPNYSLAHKQVFDWNIGNVGNGNLPTWSTLSGRDQAALYRIATGEAPLEE